MTMVADYPEHNRPYFQTRNANGEKGILFPNNGFSRPQKIRYEVVRDLQDVKACLQLRYLTYRYVNFIEENMDRLDLDPFDRYSTFLGAFNVTGKHKLLVGTVRIISGDKKSGISSHIDQLIRSARDPKFRMLGKRPKLFPIMESFRLPDHYLECFNKSKKEPGSLHPYEISRLAIRPDYWMHGIDVGLHHLLILDSWMQTPPRNDFLIAVHPRSRARYEKIGFKIIPGTGQVLYKHINQLAIAMIIDLEKFLQQPGSYRETCESLFTHFKKHGYFTRILKSREAPTYLKNNQI